MEVLHRIISWWSNCTCGVSTKRTKSRDLNRFLNTYLAIYNSQEENPASRNCLSLSIILPFPGQLDMYVTSDSISTDFPWSHICVESTVTHFSNYSWSQRLRMWGQVHFLTFQRTNDFIPVRRVTICAVHMKIRSTYLTVNLYIHPFNKELTLLNAVGTQQWMLFCPQEPYHLMKANSTFLTVTQDEHRMGKRWQTSCPQ